MAAVANNPQFAKKAGVPSAVGKEFITADKGKTFDSSTRAGINNPKTSHGKMQMPNVSLQKYVGKRSGGILLNKENEMKKMNPGMIAIMAKKKPAMKMADSGKMPMKDGKPAFLDDGKGMKKGGMAMKKPAKKMAMGGMAKGGGVEAKGKTKGKMVKMTKGGKAC